MFKINKKLTLQLSLTALMLLLSVTPVLAQPFTTSGGAGGPAGADITVQDGAFFDSSGLNADVSIGQIVARIIIVLLSFLGVIFVVLIIYAGFRWMTSRGNEEAITKAKRTMAAAVIGLAIVLGAYIITYFIIDQLLEVTRGGTGLD